MLNPTLPTVALLALFTAALSAAEPKAPAKAPAAKTPAKSAKSAAKIVIPPGSPKPTAADVSYGPDPRNVLDFWKAPNASGPTPLVFFIHGGGWNAGDKTRVYTSGLKEYLDAGISVVSINYRLVPAATEAGVKPPVKAPLTDAARALQFVRSKAAEWNIDKKRIAASGGSAGACSSLWLAFHDDMAQPDSADPIARESTRLLTAAVMGPQTTLDPHQMREWTPNSRYGGHAFGLKAFDEFHAKRAEILPWIQEYSPYANVTADDPPVYMSFTSAPAIGQEQKDPTHTANFGVKLAEKLASVGVKSYVFYPGAPDVQHKNVTEYLIATLKK